MECFVEWWDQETYQWRACLLPRDVAEAAVFMNPNEVFMEGGHYDNSFGY